MNIHVVQGADGLNRRAFSADDVRRMTEAGILGENDPFELVDGELIEMAAKGFAHDRIKMGIAGELFAAIDRRAIYVAIECTLRLEPRTLVEPDVMVCRQASIRRSQEGYVEVSGGDVLLLVEVADLSLRYDRRRKASLYAAQGVADYWIVDLNASQVLVHRDPSPSGYRDTRPADASSRLRPLAAELAGFSLRLADLV